MGDAKRLMVACAVCVLALWAAGCANQSNDAVSRLPDGEANQLNSAHAPFDSGEDPPVNAGTHFAAGQFAESQGNLTVATKQYREAIKLDPQHRMALYRLGVLCTQTKNYAEAALMWKKYIAATGGDANGYNNLGYCYEMAGAPGEAAAAYQQGIAKDPKNVACRINYGLMLARNGRIEEGRNQLAAALPPAQVNYNIGSVYEQQGFSEQARAEYMKALELDPKMTDALTRLKGLK